MQNKSREKQNTHTDAEIQTPKHESTSTNSLKKQQRSEAAPLTLPTLHLYSQTQQSKRSLHCSKVVRVGSSTYEMPNWPLLSSFCKIVRVKVTMFFGWMWYSLRGIHLPFLSLQYNNI